MPLGRFNDLRVLGHEAGDPRARSEPGIKLSVTEQNGADGVLGGTGKGKRFGFGLVWGFSCPFKARFCFRSASVSASFGN